MSDLSHLLGNVYGEQDPDGRTVRHEPHAEGRAPEWASEAKLNEAFADWKPGEAPGATPGERRFQLSEQQAPPPAHTLPLDDDLAAALSAALVEAAKPASAPHPQQPPAAPVHEIPSWQNTPVPPPHAPQTAAPRPPAQGQLPQAPAAPAHNQAAYGAPQAPRPAAPQAPHAIPHAPAAPTYSQAPHAGAQQSAAPHAAAPPPQRQVAPPLPVLAAPPAQQLPPPAAPPAPAPAPAPAQGYSAAAEPTIRMWQWGDDDIIAGGRGKKRKGA